VAQPGRSDQAPAADAARSAQALPAAAGSQPGPAAGDVTASPAPARAAAAHPPGARGSAPQAAAGQGPAPDGPFPAFAALPPSDAAPPPADAPAPIPAGAPAPAFAARAPEAAPRPAPRADAAAEAGLPPPPEPTPPPAPETTAAEAPRPPPPAPPLRQVTPAVVAVAIGGAGRLTVTLEPGELGRVEISVERGAEAPQVVILAERPETLALLQRDQRELDRALTQAGLPAEGRALSFGLSGGDAGSGQPQRRREGSGGAARALQGPAGTPGPEAPARRVALSLLDLAV
jgi:Meckel syndrome type 1 protein